YSLRDLSGRRADSGLLGLDKQAPQSRIAPHNRRSGEAGRLALLARFFQVVVGFFRRFFLFFFRFCVGLELMECPSQGCRLLVDGDHRAPELVKRDAQVVRDVYCCDKLAEVLKTRSIPLKLGEGVWAAQAEHAFELP